MQRGLEKGLSISAEVYEWIRANAAVGMREAELFLTVETMLKRMGRGQYLFDFLSGPRTADIGGDPTDRIIERNDLLLVDFSLEQEGSWCDTCRTFFFGEPTAEQAEAYGTLLSAMENGAKSIVAHADAETIYRAVKQPMELRQLGKRMPHHAGHGVGVKPFQSPVFNQDSGDQLQVGDIVTLEPGLYFPKRWGMRIENDFLVAETGAMLLFDYPLELEYFILR